MKVKKNKYRIELPEARTGMQVDYGLHNEVSAFGGGDYQSALSEPSLQLSKYITAVPRAEANLEAEGGETVYGDINGDGIPEHKIIKGPRHSNGGVPLNLPEDTFIYSDTRGMKLKDPDLLQAFGKTGNKAHTPASLAKQYDIDKYRKILQDPDSDVVDRKTAEMMIRNYNLKLGALALAQEAKKGFPQGIPEVSRPYMEANGIQDSDLMDTELKGLNDQIEGQIESKEEQMEQGEPEMGMEDVEMAQQMNQGMPVATPEQAPGMFMGGGMLADDGMIYAQDGQAMMEQPQPQQMSQGEDQQIMQLIQAFIQITESSEEEVMRLLQSAKSEEEVQALLQQMSQVVQEYMQSEMQQAPMAKYGMAMGGYDMPFVPEMEEMVMEDGGDIEELPIANNGLIVKREDYPDGAEGDKQYRLAIRTMQRKNPGEKVYGINADGKKQLASIKNVAPTETGSATFGTGKGDWPDTKAGHLGAAKYYMLEKGLEDQNIANKFLEEYQNVTEDEKHYKNKKGKASDYYDKRKQLQAITADKIKAGFLASQKRNLMFQAQGISPTLYSNSGAGFKDWKKFEKNHIGKSPIMNPETGEEIKTKADFETVQEYLKNNIGSNLSDASKKLGYPVPTDGLNRAMEQGTFHAYTQMIESAPNYDDNLQGQLSNFLGYQQVGEADETGQKGSFKGTSINISPIDSIEGDTTFGHIGGNTASELSFEDVEEEIIEEEQQECICIDSDGTRREVGTDPNTGECMPCREDVATTNVEVDEPAPWWLQDTIKTTGAFGDLMGVKKYMPFAAKADLEVPRPTYLDPTRELAANAEQANIQTQAIGQFAGAQAQSARASSIQGTAAKQAADTLSRVNNQNVNIANEFATNAANIRNQEQLQNQATNQRLYDQTTIANQQFDNAKLAMRNNFRNQFTNAITNRYQTDALNQLYPQYNVDPSVGGKLTFDPTKARQIDGRGAAPKKSYGEYMKECIAEGVPEDDKANLKACVGEKMANAKLSAGTTDNSAAVMQQYAGQKKEYGGQMGPGVYANMVFPFIL